MEKFKGKFDQGWDKYREETYQRQLELGVIPKDTKLTPRPQQIPAWDSLTDDQRKVAARLMEAFAGYTAQTDHEVGRLIQLADISGLARRTAPQPGLHHLPNRQADIDWPASRRPPGRF
jgi:arylsulfatase